MTIRIMFCPEMTKPNGKSYEVAVVSISPRIARPEFDQLTESILADLPRIVGESLQESINSPHSSLWVKVED